MLQQLFELIRFGISGSLATLVHLLVVYLLRALVDQNPYLANLFGFSIAFIVAFSLHFFWTFKGQNNLVPAMIKYFIIAFGAFLFSNVALAAILKVFEFSNMVTLVISVLTIPPIVFVASKFWAFKVSEVTGSQ